MSLQDIIDKRNELRQIIFDNRSEIIKRFNDIRELCGFHRTDLDVGGLAECYIYLDGVFDIEYTMLIDELSQQHLDNIIAQQKRQEEKRKADIKSIEEREYKQYLKLKEKYDKQT